MMNMKLYEITTVKSNYQESVVFLTQFLNVNVRHRVGHRWYID